jgi:hypothetical protein
MAHYGRDLFHFQNVTFSVTFSKVAFCRQEYPTFCPAHPQLYPGVLDALAGVLAAPVGCFGCLWTGKHSTDRARRFRFVFLLASLWFRAVVSVSGILSTVSGSGRALVNPSMYWRACPCLRIGSRPRLPGSGCLLPVCNLSDIAPDRATLNPVFFLPCVYFLNMVFLEGQKVVFWTFRYWLNMP